MSYMVDRLGYVIKWSQGKMQLACPTSDEIKVHLQHRCPQVARKTAIKIIQKLENGALMKTFILKRRILHGVNGTKT